MNRVFDHMPVGEKGLKEIYKWIDRYVVDHSEIAEKIIIGKSEDHIWDIPAIIVTNKSVPIEKKQIAIISLARHGNERGTRVVGPEILNYLASNEAATIRNRQVVIVIPVVNPVGVINDSFNSSLYGITDHEKNIFGKLCAMFTPDMMIDFHSLGKVQGDKCDLGDMEVIIPANLTKWGMDEQIYQHVSNRLREAAGANGWPYEIHTLEDLNSYYFGDSETGKLPHRCIEEKVFLLHIQDTYERYDDFPNQMKYTNYTNGPAYMRWHTFVMGVETNHWSIKIEDGMGESGMIIARELLNMGNKRFAWEKYDGYPTNLIIGNFRISVRATGKTPGERRESRERIWGERSNFNILKREFLEDPKVTLAQLGYNGDKAPLYVDLCLRMRQDGINKVLVDEREVEFETFKDNCSTYLSIPIVINAPGLSKIKIIHETYKKRENLKKGVNNP